MVLELDLQRNATSVYGCKDRQDALRISGRCVRIIMGSYAVLGRKPDWSEGGTFSMSQSYHELNSQIQTNLVVWFIYRSLISAEIKTFENFLICCLLQEKLPKRSALLGD